MALNTADSPWHLHRAGCTTTKKKVCLPLFFDSLPYSLLPQAIYVGHGSACLPRQLLFIHPHWHPLQGSRVNKRWVGVDTVKQGCGSRPLRGGMDDVRYGYASNSLLCDSAKTDVSSDADFVCAGSGKSRWSPEALLVAIPRFVVRGGEGKPQCRKTTKATSNGIFTPRVEAIVQVPIQLSGEKSLNQWIWMMYLKMCHKLIIEITVRQARESRRSM
jgi:hypothetical protein